MSIDEVVRAADEVLARATVGLAKAQTVLDDCTTRPLLPLGTRDSSFDSSSPPLRGGEERKNPNREGES